MTQTMRAFVMTEPGSTAIVEKPIPKPGPNDVLVRTTVGLLCTPDVHTVRGAMVVPNGRTLGHESVGVVAEVGSNVTRLQAGQRVATAAATPCWRSDCQRGYSSQCGGPLGAYKFTVQMDGNMAEYFIVPNGEANLAVIPDELSDDAAVYSTVMLSTGFIGAEHAYLRFGDTVAIFAQGPVGLAATLAARSLGAGTIIAVESRPERQALSRRFGADHIVDFTQGDTVQQILELTGGKGVEHRLSRGEPEPAAVAAGCDRPWHERQVDQPGHVRGWGRAYESHPAYAGQRSRRPDAHDHPPVLLRPGRARVRDAVEQDRQHHQAAHHLLTLYP